MFSQNNWIWKSLLSLLVISIYLFIALSSFDPGYILGKNGLLMYLILYHKDETTPGIEKGTYTLTETYVGGATKTTNGRRDNKGRWNGLTKITFKGDPPKDYDFREEVPMVHGVRHGIATVILLKDESFHYECYNMGVKIDCEDFILKKIKEVSAFQTLSEKYPWYHSGLNVLEFSDDSIQNYMDTLEIMLNAYEFEPKEFDNYYSDVIDILEDTPHDSIITYSDACSYAYGIDEMKNFEFRLAVIDYYRLEGFGLYEIVQTNYPNYLLSLNETGVYDEDFEKFCEDFEDTLALFESLEPDDPYFVDSIDTYLFYSLLSFYLEEETEQTIDFLRDKKGFQMNTKTCKALYHKLIPKLQSSSKQSTTAEIAEILLYSVFMLYEQGDIMKKATKEAYYIRNEIPRLPIVTTALSEQYSETNTALAGYIIDDGGVEITEKGIAWAEFYNPCIEDNKVNPEPSANDFIITFTDLTEGITYFARTYAVSSAGIAYGNCVSFVPGSTEAPIHIVNIAENEDFNIYPNPASAFTTLCIYNEKGDELLLSVINNKGQVALMNNLGTSLQGKNTFHIDLSCLPEGLYICHLKINNSIMIAKKLMIVR